MKNRDQSHTAHACKRRSRRRPLSESPANSRCPVRLPKPVRDGLGVETGDRVEFVELDGGVYTVVAATRDIRDLKGVIAKPAKPVSVEEMNKAVRRHAVR